MMIVSFQRYKVMASLSKLTSASLEFKPSLRILIVVYHHNTFDSLVQILQRLKPLPEFTHASTTQQVIQSLETRPDLILVDPFLIAPSTSGKPFSKISRQACGSMPVIALLPEDTRSYRDAAIDMGANAAVALERAAEDLIPTIGRLLTHVNLFNGVSEQIQKAANASAPAGEAALMAPKPHSNLEFLSRLAVERLVDELVPLDLDKNIGETEIQPREKASPTFIRSLTLTANAKRESKADAVFRTACNLNCGAHYCGLKVTVREGHIVNISAADFPDARFKRICLKGISNLQIVAHPRRLRFPLKRSGARGSGGWERISWNQALDEISARMLSLQHQYGRRALMFFPYSGQLSYLNGFYGVYLRLASALGASGTHDAQFGIDSAVPSGIEDTLGAGAGYKANDYSDLINSRLVLIWGADPVQTRMNWWPFFQEARQSGTRLVCIDPKFTPTASKSDDWMRIRPGSDLYLGLAMLSIILENGWYDYHFLLAHSVAPFLVSSENGKYLHSGDDPSLQNDNYWVWDRDKNCPVPSQASRHPALSASFSVGGRQYRTAFDLLREAVAEFTPEKAAENTGIDPARIVKLAQDYATTKPARIYTLYGIDRWHHGAAFGRMIATLAAVTGNIGIAGGGAGVDGMNESFSFSTSFYQPAGTQYAPVNPLLLPQYIVRQEPYPIKSVMVAFSNWLNQFPDRNYMMKTVLPQLDLLVVADLFLTDTAQWADYVLPTSSFLEREDMVKGPGPYLQYQPGIVPPPGECRSDFEIASELGKRMGVGAYLSGKPADYLHEAFQSDDPALAGLSFEALKEEGVLQRKLPPKAPIAHHEMNFKTPSGRIEFFVERLLPYKKAWPSYQPPIEAQPNSPYAQKYPLVCIMEHTRYSVHSTFRNAPWLRELDSEPTVILHPADAGSRQILDGDLVRVFNDRGEVTLKACLSRAAHPGSVYFSQGWQSQDFVSGHTQSLTHSESDPSNFLGANASFSDVLVDVILEKKEPE
jgi:anaerobic selenocysteine-containing dehydrogenase/DNA-binding NarL/FixJ family response regulator